MYKKLLPSVLLLVAFLHSAQASDSVSCSGSPRLQAPLAVSLIPEAVKPVGSKIRFCSYNIQDFTDGLGDGSNRTPALARTQARHAAGLIRSINPDVVVMQEIENGESVAMLNESFRKPYPLAYVARFGSGTQRKDKLNIALLSRVPIANLREIDFEYMDGNWCPVRGVLSFTIPAGKGHRFLVYAVHLKSNFGERARNIAMRESAMRLIRKDADYLVKKNPGIQWEVMVLGDMNVDPDDWQFKKDTTLAPLADWHDLWLGRSLSERATVPTRHGNPMLEFPPACFDRFIVSPGLKLEPWVAGEPVRLLRGVNTDDITAVPGLGRDHISDHYPVYLDIWR